MRARFILDVRISPEREHDFVQAYAALRTRLEDGVPGLLGHQLCQSADDPSHWIIVSEWENHETSAEWLQSTEHRELIEPLRRCMQDAGSEQYLVRDGLG
jgi:heme-degrading monooxygenase HmoA